MHIPIPNGRHRHGRPVDTADQARKLELLDFTVAAVEVLPLFGLRVSVAISNTSEVVGLHEQDEHGANHGQRERQEDTPEVPANHHVFS